MGKYASSPDWEDIDPIPQDDGGPNPLAAIAYTEEYSEAMSYLRAVMAKDEKSQRVLSLTQDVIRMNPAHYTVWLYRADTIFALNEDLHRELQWLNKIALKSLKNYQIWHHRQTIMSHLPSLPPTELSFLATMFAQDAKNYHVWSYRQWLVQHFSLWEDNPESSEISYIEYLLDNDVRNNSAWNHRWFIVFGRAERRRHDLVSARRKAAANDNISTPSAKTSGLENQPKSSSQPPPPPPPNDASTNNDSTANPNPNSLSEPDPAPTPEIIDREIAFARTAIDLAPQNPSPWNYLRGILRFTNRPLASQRAFAERYADIEQQDRIRSSHALDFLADVYIISSSPSGPSPSSPSSSSASASTTKGKTPPPKPSTNPTQPTNNDQEEEKQAGIQKAGKALELLARKYDPIRKNYWNYRRSLIGLPEVIVDIDI